MHKKMLCMIGVILYFKIFKTKPKVIEVELLAIYLNEYVEKQNKK